MYAHTALKTPSQPPPARALAPEAAVRAVEELLAAGAAAPAYDLACAAAGAAAMAGMPNPDLCLLAGSCAIHLERMAEAEAWWRQCLEAAPQAVAAHFNLGVLYASQGRLADAERHYRGALAHDPGHADACGNLAALLARTGRAAEAESGYRAEIALRPSPRAYTNLGALLAALGRHAEAVEACRKAVALEPAYALAWANLGAAHVGLQEWNEAEQAYRNAAAYDPANAAACSNLGIVLARAGSYAEAEASYRRALELSPQLYEAHTNLGLLLDARGRDAEAEDCHRAALAVRPDAPEVLSNLGLLLEKLRRFDEAEASMRQAVGLRPGSGVFHANLGALLASGGRTAEAEACLRQAAGLDPRHAQARLNLSYLLLGQGRYAEGWNLFEARADPRLELRASLPPAVDYPCWQGESLQGKSVLVWNEQGYGDEIQFARYAHILKRRGASRITWACKTPLLPVLQTLAAADRAIPAGDAAEAGPHDYWTFPMSIPRHVHAGDDVSAAPLAGDAEPYLSAAPERIAQWAPRLSATGLKVGLVWQGNPNNPNDAERSLPSLDVLAPLWTVPGVSFISLQKGGWAEGEARQAHAAGRLLHMGSEIADFGDSAAIVQQLDLMICVDTALAHLSGALGKPCWILLPHYKTDWRWLKNREDTPWYPRARLFRQPMRGDWASVTARLVSALAEWTLGLPGQTLDQPSRLTSPRRPAS